ncbi:MAG: proline--tRNA ligase, partial [FCB group bacterium]|nr:proline--tRNA ligase [FCB group bacterium]
DEEHAKVMAFIDELISKMKELRYQEEKIRFQIDDRDMRGGEKLWDWIKKGVPIRLEIGPRDIENNSVFMGRRDKDAKDKTGMKVDDFVSNLTEILDDIQQNIYDKALKFRKENTINIDDKDEFYKFFTPKNMNNPEIHGGFAWSHWCGNPECEEKIKDDLKVTIRCIPIDAMEETGKCIYCGKESKKRVIFAKAY